MADQEFTTVLGPDVSIKGELSFEKAVRLQGKFEGEVRTGGLLHVDREASLTGDVKAGNVRVDGTVRGNLSANGRIELKESSDHEGDLTAGKLIVEEGAVFKGHVTVGPNAVKAGGKKDDSADDAMPIRNGLAVSTK
ncbi:MAG: polymer-forming cytoskeletal protein [Planctomycetota bacterium]